MARRARARQGRPTAAARPQQALRAAVSAYRQGRADETAALCARILETRPHDAGALHLLGAAYLALGQAADAVEALTRAAAAEPRNAEIHVNLGSALRADGRAEAAERSLRRALALDANNVQAHFNLGNALSESGRAAEAAACFRRVIRLNPSHAGAHNNLGLALEALDDGARALASFRAAAAAAPGHRDAHRNIARLLREDGRLAEALAQYDAAVAALPHDAALHNDRGVVLFEIDRVEEARAALARALALDPNSVDAHINLGNVLCTAADAGAAVGHFERALALDPGAVDAVVNLGHARKQQGRFADAVAAYDRALAAAPDHQEAAFGKGVCRLLEGAFADGWRGYLRRESMRAADPDFHRETLPGDLRGKRVLVVRDQGIGDEIFFLRFLPRLAARGAKLAYRPDPRLAAMFARAGLAEIVTGERADPDHDLKLSVGDLPHLLGMATAAEIPPSIRLPALAERSARLGETLAAFGPPPHVGVAWRAGTRGRQNLLYKESPTTLVARALAPLAVSVVVLQRNPKPGEVAAFAAALGRPVCDLTALNDDIEDMLALVGLLDDHVCVSNTNVHLAAARGRTCRLLIPNPPEFRWMASGRESPWFPGMTVYRQGADGDWSVVMDTLARDLAAAL